MAEVGTDFPGDREVVDVLAGSIGEGMTSVVQRSDADGLVVSVAQTAAGRRVRLDVGERLQLVWKGAETLRGVPVELVAVTLGDEPSWQLRIAGPAVRVQRREAVRAPLRVPVQVSAGGEEQAGWSGDLSEGGLRFVVPAAPTDADGAKPGAAGDLMRVTLQLGDLALTDEVRLVRRHHREDRMWEVSVQFTGLTEKEQDAVRAAVFAELRARAAQGLD